MSEINGNQMFTIWRKDCSSVILWLFPFFLSGGGHHSLPCSQALYLHGSSPRAEAESETSLEWNLTWRDSLEMLSWMERGRCNGLSQVRSTQIWLAVARRRAVASHCSWTCSVQLDVFPSGHMITLSTTNLFSYEDFSESSFCLKHVSAINYS